MAERSAEYLAFCEKAVSVARAASSQAIVVKDFWALALLALASDVPQPMRDAVRSLADTVGNSGNIAGAAEALIDAIPPSDRTPPGAER